MQIAVAFPSRWGLSRAFRSFCPFHLYLSSEAHAKARRGSRHAELIYNESCPLGSAPPPHSAPAGGQGNAVIKIDGQKLKVGYLGRKEQDEKKKRKRKWFLKTALKTLVLQHLVGHFHDAKSPLIPLIKQSVLQVF